MWDETKAGSRLLLTFQLCVDCFRSCHCDGHCQPVVFKATTETDGKEHAQTDSQPLTNRLESLIEQGVGVNAVCDLPLQYRQGHSSESIVDMSF